MTTTAGSNSVSKFLVGLETRRIRVSIHWDLVSRICVSLTYLRFCSHHARALLSAFLANTRVFSWFDKGSKHRPRESFVKTIYFRRKSFTTYRPVPDSLHHRYVGFAPFIKAMFKKKGIEGIILHRALHKQHCSVYKWDKNVIWGVIEDDADARR